MGLVCLGVEQANLTADRVYIADNFAINGGALALAGVSTVHLTDSHVLRSSATHLGGAVYAAGSTVKRGELLL